MIEKLIKLNQISLIDFWGAESKNYKKLVSLFPKCKMVNRGDEIKIQGSKKDVTFLSEFLDILIDHYNRFGELSPEKIEEYFVQDAPKEEIEESINQKEIILYGNRGLIIKAKSNHQKELVAAIRKTDITFAVGPAGTGKTFLSVALAIAALKEKTVRKIIITRPAVEAGENLGYLPGDLREKVDPYLRPIYDALEDMIPSEKLAYYKENNIIEIAPLAFMRGRTLQHAFVIMDEAQNATAMQMKMVLTRLGPDSKMVITGDVSQTDLKGNQRSGLEEALNVLKNINGISIIKLDAIDVVRHKLVRKIIEAYDKI